MGGGYNANLVFVKDASENRRRVEVGHAIAFNCTRMNSQNDQLRPRAGEWLKITRGEVRRHLVKSSVDCGSLPRCSNMITTDVGAPLPPVRLELLDS